MSDFLRNLARRAAGEPSARTAEITPRRDVVAVSDLLMAPPAGEPIAETAEQTAAKPSRQPALMPRTGEIPAEPPSATDSRPRSGDEPSPGNEPAAPKPPPLLLSPRLPDAPPATGEAFERHEAADPRGQQTQDIAPAPEPSTEKVPHTSTERPEPVVLRATTPSSPPPAEPVVLHAAQPASETSPAEPAPTVARSTPDERGTDPTIREQESDQEGGVDVHIGTLEVRVAPEPTTPQRPPRAPASRGFRRYGALRSYRWPRD